MARQLRPEFPGAVYHLMARGNAKQDIYLDDTDRRDFLFMLWDVCERLGWLVAAYCLMPNHYHLLVQTTQANLSFGMHDLNGRYSIAFNRRHRRVGHVFQGRFRSRLVDGTKHLLDATRYVVMNPVKAGLCHQPESWTWSSYRTTVAAKDRGALRPSLVLSPLGADLTRAAETFVEFVHADGLAEDPFANLRIPTIIGGEAFIATVSAHVGNPSNEVPKAERALKALAAYAREFPARNAAIRAAYASGTYTQAEIARHFGLHYTTVCKVIDNRSCRDAKNQDVTPIPPIPPIRTPNG